MAARSLRCSPEGGLIEGLQQTLLALKSDKQIPRSKSEIWSWPVPCRETTTAFRDNHPEKVNNIMGVSNMSLPQLMRHFPNSRPRWQHVFPLLGFKQSGESRYFFLLPCPSKDCSLPTQSHHDVPLGLMCSTLAQFGRARTGRRSVYT